MAALALQGPTSRRLLQQVCDADLSTLKYFRATSGSIAGVPVDVSRTGYTGDLGYEIWMPWQSALQVWDAIVSAGTAFDLHPTGMLALDMARIEAGLLLIDVDFQSSRKALIETQKYSPVRAEPRAPGGLEEGAVRRPGRAQRRGEARHRAADCRDRIGLDRASRGCTKRWGCRQRRPRAPPALRCPSTKAGKQVGRATSTTWSTTLKKFIALATVDAPHYAIGTRVEMEVTVEAVRHRARGHGRRDAFLQSETQD